MSGAAARRVAAGSARRGRRYAAGVVLTPWLRLRRPAVSDAELGGALGGASLAEVLRAEVLGSLPTVTDWVAALDADPAAHDGLLEQATAILEHRFDLLGSGTVELGDSIDWHTDFKTGRRWPLRHPHLLRTSYADGSDIKVPWELSRAQHLPVLAAAHRVTHDERYVAEIRAQLADWTARNPPALGVNWACTMDVSIRAVNWLAALAMLADAGIDEPWMRDPARDLLIHARFIRAHPEHSLVRGNHYLSNVVGLLLVTRLFARCAEGAEHAAWAAAELLAELELQVRDDGVVHEASISYHRLVTELFVCGLQAAQAAGLGPVGDEQRERLARALRFTADYTRADGLAPQVGDADDGRLLPLGDYGADPRDHGHLFRQARRPRPEPAAEAAYAAGGFYMARRRGTFLLVRCGDVGMSGRGVHAHNDQLSFELAAGSQPLIVDAGAYLYTAAPQWRNRFRSTASHTTLQVDGREQNPLPKPLFLLPEHSRAECLEWSPSTDGAVRFTGRHKGFAPHVHTRALTLAADGATLEVRDQVEGPKARDLTWTFTLAPGRAELVDDGVHVDFGLAQLEILAEGVNFELEPGWLSPSYGVKTQTTFVRAHRTPVADNDETVFDLRVRS